VALWAWGLSTFMASPAFFGWSWDAIAVHSRARDYLRLCQDPFTRDLIEPITAYRLVLPLVAWLLHLPPVAALVLPYLAHVGFLAVCFAAVRRRAEPVVALLATIMIALSFALFWSNWRPGFTDTLTHLLAASLLLTTSPSWVIAAIILGCLNDERMVLALPFALCWHFPPTLTAAWLRSAARWLLASLLALVVYGVLRHALTVGWVGPGIVQPAVYRGIGRDLVEFRPHLGSWSVWSLNVFLSFRWGWILIVAYLSTRAWQSQTRLAAGLFVAALALGTLASATVADVSRSVGFMATAWLLAIAGLAKSDPERTRTLLLRVDAALVLTPVFFTFEHFHVQWFRPLPLVLYRCMTGGDLVPLPGQP
jgi:hypothetical protein